MITCLNVWKHLRLYTLPKGTTIRFESSSKDCSNCNSNSLRPKLLLLCPFISCMPTIMVEYCLSVLVSVSIVSGVMDSRVRVWCATGAYFLSMLGNNSAVLSSRICASSAVLSEDSFVSSAAFALMIDKHAMFCCVRFLSGISRSSLATTVTACSNNCCLSSWAWGLCSCPSRFCVSIGCQACKCI